MQSGGECVTMRRAQRVPISASQVRALVGEAGRPERVEPSEDGDWIVTSELQREYKKALGLHEKTGTVGERDVEIRVHRQDFGMEEVKRAVQKLIEKTENQDLFFRKKVTSKLETGHKVLAVNFEDDEGGIYVAAVREQSNQNESKGKGTPNKPVISNESRG